MFIKNRQKPNINKDYLEEQISGINSNMSGINSRMSRLDSRMLELFNTLQTHQSPLTVDYKDVEKEIRPAKCQNKEHTEDYLKAEKSYNKVKNLKVDGWFECGPKTARDHIRRAVHKFNRINKTNLIVRIHQDPRDPDKKAIVTRTQ